MSVEDFEDYNLEDDDEVELVNPLQVPIIGDPEWHDYVMSHFREDEVVIQESGDILPKCHGLRRVAELLLGPVQGGVKQVIYPTGERHTVAVVYEIMIGDPASGLPMMVYSEVADTNVDNTDQFFLQYAPATASTKAEARALRKALHIKGIAADEIRQKDFNTIMGAEKDTGVDYDDEGLAEEKQLNYIGVLAKKSDIDVIKLLDSCGYKLDGFTKAQAREVIAKVNDYRGGRVETPQEIIGFNKKWRD